MQLKVKVANLETLVQKQSTQIANMQSVILQLIGGLFHPDKQSEMIDLHICVLNGYPLSNDSFQSDNSPTTRQGDKLEERMKHVEELLSTVAASSIIPNYGQLELRSIDEVVDECDSYSSYPSTDIESNISIEQDNDALWYWPQYPEEQMKISDRSPYGPIGPIGQQDADIAWHPFDSSYDQILSIFKNRDLNCVDE